MALCTVLELLRDEGNVTHVVLISRNPLRAQIALETSVRFGSLFGTTEDRVVCADQRGMFDITPEKAWELTLAQYRGFSSALDLPGLEKLGLSYEADVTEDITRAVRGVADMLDKVFHEGRDGDLSHEKETGCLLSTVLFNYDELRCRLEGTPLASLLLTDYSINAIGEKQQQGQGQQQTAVVVPSFQHFCDTVFAHLTHASAAGTVNSLLHNSNSLSSNSNKIGCGQDNFTKSSSSLLASAVASAQMVKIDGDCGHGGHNDVCRSYGLVREYVCIRLLTLQSRCDSLTYRDGVCYLHDRRSRDFWTDRCLAPPGSYFAYTSSSSSSGSSQFKQLTRL